MASWSSSHDNIPAGSLPVRIYTRKSGSGPFPVVVYYHGGGWVMMSWFFRNYLSGAMDRNDPRINPVAAGRPEDREDVAILKAIRARN